MKDVPVEAEKNISIVVGKTKDNRIYRKINKVPFRGAQVRTEVHLNPKQEQK